MHFTRRCPGLSENITLRSVIGRYLEHSRIFYFHHGDNPIHAIASADWMTRNLDRRVEHLVVISNPKITQQLDDILRIFLSDVERSRLLGPEDGYERLRKKPGEGLDCQDFFASKPREQAKQIDALWGSKRDRSVTSLTTAAARERSTPCMTAALGQCGWLAAAQW